MTGLTEVRQEPKRGRWVALLVLCLIGAAAAARRIIAVTHPSGSGAPDLAGPDAHFAAEAALTLVHVVPSLLFVLLLPPQFIKALRQRHPKWHRWTGRVLMVLGIVLAASALSLSLHPVGGVVESSATILFGCFFLLALGKAWWHIRHGRVAAHREWVTRMTAIALGVATTRPIMGVFFATSRLTGLTPHQFFGPAMWLGLSSTYLVAELWLLRRGRAERPRELAVESLPAR